MLATKKPLVRLNPLRLPRRKNVTLIAGFKSPEGFVLCADSQETVDAYRVSRQKLIPEFHCGNFDIAVAGAGNNGELIDAFVQRLYENLRTSKINSIHELKNFIHEELLDFQKNEAAAYSRKDRYMRFIIGARSLNSAACEAWVSSASRLTEIRAPALIGWVDYRYEDIAQRLYRSDLSILQGIFLGLHLMSLAENTSNYVKRPVSIVIVRDNVMKQEDRESVSALQERVRIFGSQFDAVFLSCPDTGLSPAQFSAKLQQFIDTIVHLRKDYTEEAIQDQISQGLNKVNDAYPTIPVGTTISFNLSSASAQDLQKATEDTIKDLRDHESGQQSYERIIVNLTAIKSYLESFLAHEQNPSVEPPSQTLKGMALKALGEIAQAAFMGPYKISENASKALNGVTAIANNLDLGFGEQGNAAIKLSVINQCILAISREPDATPSNPEKSEQGP